MTVKFSSLLFLLNKMTPEDLEQEAHVYIRTYGRTLPLVAFAPEADAPTSPDNPMRLIVGTEHQ